MTNFYKEPQAHDKYTRTGSSRSRSTHLALGALTITNLLTAFLLIQQKRNQEHFINPYPLLDPTRSLIPQENFIVNIQPLRDVFNLIASKEDLNSFSLYFEFLNTGANININPDVRIWPASLPKLPLAMAVMKKIENGAWSLDSELVLFNQDKDTKYGTLWEKPEGSRLTIRDLLEELLAKSDNTAHWILLRNMEDFELAAVRLETGLEALFTNDGLVSAKEYSRLFRSLYVSSFLKRENSEFILGLLSKAGFKDFLASGVPAHIVFSHKFGIDRNRHSYLDSGIIYVSGRPYILTVAIKGTGAALEEKRIDALMKEISERAYDYVAH